MVDELAGKGTKRALLGRKKKDKAVEDDNLREQERRTSCSGVVPSVQARSRAAVF